MTKRTLTLLLLLCLPSICYSAERKVYVDPGVVAGDGSGDSWINAYSSMVLAETGEQGDLTAGGRNEIVVFTCLATGGTADTGGKVYFNSWDTDATHYIKWWTDPADGTKGDCRHDGTYDTSKYRVEHTNDDAVYIRENNIRIEGIQLNVTSANGNTDNPLICTGVDAGDIWISHCIIKLHGSVDYTQIGMHLSDDSPTYKVWNNLIFNGHTTKSSYGISADGTSYIYNNTINDCAYGIRQASGDCRIRNNIVQDSGTGDYTGTLHADSRRNIGNMTPAEAMCFGTAVDSGTCDENEVDKLHDDDQDFITTCIVGFIVKNTTDTTYGYIVTIDDNGELTLDHDLCPLGSENYEIYPNFYSDVTFEGEGADNFHLGAAAQIAKDNGWDVDTGSGDTLPVDDDVDGDARHATTPDIGFDEEAEEEPPSGDSQVIFVSKN